VRKPETVSYYKHSAKIYKANDGFHATWYLNGKRVKKQFSTLRNAKESALEALRLIHKGEGDLAHLSPVKKAGLIEIQRIFSEEKIDSPLALVREYQEAKRIAPKTDLISIAKFWADNAARPRVNCRPLATNSSPVLAPCLRRRSASSVDFNTLAKNNLTLYTIF
tara:strand:- start:332 stop:826 length:495 start_codon:yes stop_codon:yes gene_type:complete